MRNITLYNEIKAKVQEAMEAEANAAAWKGFSKECLAEARMLTATAKKMKANQGIEFDFKSLQAFIAADLAEETEPKTTDFPASENTEEVESGQPDSSPANEEEPYESENL